MKKRKQMSQRLVCAFFLLALLAQTAARAVTVESTGVYLCSEVSAPAYGDEWAVLGLARSGIKVPQGNWNRYIWSVEQTVRAKNGVLHAKKYTEYARVVIALTALGEDPQTVAGYDLLKPLSDFEKVAGQGINGVIWALIALDCGHYPMPVDTGAPVLATRQMYVDVLLDKQCSTGGWSVSGRGSADVDLTAMALQALAGYQDRDAVKTAVNRALLALQGLQNSDGSFPGGCESAAQVLTALCELGLSPDDRRFVKNGRTLTDVLWTYRLEDGSFVHKTGDRNSSLVATEQAYYALVSAERVQSGKSSLYHMGTAPGTGLSGKESAVSSRPVTAPGKTFSDIAGHAAQRPIEALAERGIIDGKDVSRFDPDAQMTRAEFAAIVVRALGLPTKTVSAFSDVPSNRWYAPYVGAAYANGIVSGKDAGRFDPDGTITRQEAAVMVTRAAVLCGMDTSLEQKETERLLEPYRDRQQIATWAKTSVAYCRLTDVSPWTDTRAAPNTAVCRHEVAQMLYQVLKGANLM